MSAFRPGDTVTYLLPADKRLIIRGPQQMVICSYVRRSKHPNQAIVDLGAACGKARYRRVRADRLSMATFKRAPGL